MMPAGDAGPRRRGANLLLWLIAIFSSVAGLPGQLEIQSSRWGFDGRVVVQKFNLLTVIVHNPTDKSFRGAASLVETAGFESVGARYVEPCYLGPGATRKIQLFPFVSTGTEEWSLDIGGAGLKFSPFASPGEGARLVASRPATVILSNVARLTQPTAGVPLFSSRDFPNTVAGTGGLGRLLLDHDPDAQSGQRRALLDWVLSGGELHLFHSGANYPLFQGELDILNDEEMANLGHGRIVRHPYRLGTRSETGLLPQKPQDNPADFAGALGQGLRSVVTPKHNWALIYAVLVLFFLGVVPLHAWLSMRKVHYGISVLLLLCMVAVATGAIFFIGRRGYGEASAVHAFSHVRVLEPGRHEVTQVKNVFSTTSLRTSIRHEAAGSLYATVNNLESVPGAAFSKGPARLEMSIPLFTSRGLIHRGVVEAEPIQAVVKSWPEGEGLSGLVIDWGGPSPVKAFAFRGPRGARATLSGGVLSFPRGDRNLKRVLGETGQSQHWVRSRGMLRVFHPPGTTLRKVADDMLPGWIAHRLNIESRASRTITASDSVRLVVVCPQPEGFHISGETVNESGFAIYDLVLRQGE